MTFIDAETGEVVLTFSDLRRPAISTPSALRSGVSGHCDGLPADPLVLRRDRGPVDRQPHEIDDGLIRAGIA